MDIKSIQDNCIQNFIERETDLENCTSIEDAVEWAVDAAYSDAKRTMKGIGSFKEKKEKAIEKICKKILEYLDSDKPKHSEDFDRVHSELCQIWIDAFKDNDIGQYGKAQKIVNMAFKYLYCYFYYREEGEDWKDCYKYCHMPLDSYTLAMLPRKYEGEKVITSETKWSTLDFSSYEKLRDNARAYVKELFNGEISVLEAEFILWDCSIIFEANEYYKKTFEKYEKRCGDLIKAVEGKESLDDYIRSIIQV